MIQATQGRAAELADQAAAVWFGDVVRGGLLSETAPLRGRAGLEMIVPTSDYRLAAQFWGIDDPHLAVLLFSVVGGTPAYRDGVAGGHGPESVGDLGHWVSENVLSRFSPLFREARYLLAEEPQIRDTGVCHSVLAAVADGNSTRGGIASYLDRKATYISHHLSVLEDAGLLARDVDVFRPGRSVYRIAEPLIAFHHAVMRPEWSRLERRGLAAEVWRENTHRFVTAAVGPQFEQICRDWMQAYAPTEINSVPISQVGRSIVNDPEQKKSHQVDVVAFGNDIDGRRVLLAIGEAKWSETIGMGLLACSASGPSCPFRPGWRGHRTPVAVRRHGTQRPAARLGGGRGRPACESRRSLHLKGCRQAEATAVVVTQASPTARPRQTRSCSGFGLQAIHLPVDGADPL